MKWSIAFAFLGVIALLTILTHFESESPRGGSPQALVEIQIEQLLLTRYGEEGKKLEQSSAVQAIRLEKYSTTHFSELEVRRRDRQGQEWVLISPSGMSDASDDTVRLEGGVAVSRGDSVNLLTDTVVIDVASGKAVSTNKTQLISDKSSSVADGLVIDFEQGTAELVGQVRSTYQRSRKMP